MSGELQSRYTWDLSGSSAGVAVDFQGFGVETTFYVHCGPSGTTGVFSIQSARSAAGPWATIASTRATDTNALTIQEVTGPLLFVRPVVPSTGYTVEAVSFG